MTGIFPFVYLQPENGLDNDIQENLANMHDVINKEQKERIASIYLRILGNELGYVTLDDIKSLIPVIDKQMLEGMVQEVGISPLIQVTL